MLVLSRKLNESICVGEGIVIKVVKIRGSVVGLGIVAPDDVKIMRSELIERDRQRGPKETADSRPSSLSKQPTSGTLAKSFGRNAPAQAVSDQIENRRSPSMGVVANALPIAALDVDGLVSRHSVASVTVAS